MKTSAQALERVQETMSHIHVAMRADGVDPADISRSEVHILLRDGIFGDPPILAWYVPCEPAPPPPTPATWGTVPRVSAYVSPFKMFYWRFPSCASSSGVCTAAELEVLRFTRVR